jgi:hypothetical protein
VLKAISLVETKVWNQDSGRYLTWPWTANIEGKPHRYKSKEEAISHISQLYRNGKRSIDVSCMQVNLRHHPNAFSTIEQAFDPEYNIAYAASFLQSNFNRHRDWHKAIAAYHSETYELGQGYLNKVLRHWHGADALPPPKKTISQIQKASIKRDLKTNNKRRTSPIMIKVSSTGSSNTDVSDHVAGITDRVLDKFSK